MDQPGREVIKVGKREDFSAFERSLTRRGFVRVMGKIGIGVVGGMAGVIGTVNPVEAACGDMACGATSPNWRCCSLNKPNNFCPLDSGGHPAQCNGGYLYTWACCCCGVARTYTCAECMYVNAGTCCTTVSNTICSDVLVRSPSRGDGDTQ